MKGQTTNEVRAKVPGGNHCDQDLLDALDEIDAMRAEIDRKNDAMGSMIRELVQGQTRIKNTGLFILGSTRLMQRITTLPKKR